MTNALRILVVGGYGVFGGRVVALLEDEPGLTLVVAGRSLARAGAFCAGRASARALLVPAAFDRDGDARAAIAALAPDILIDASGPFQAYGEGRYSVIEACVALGVNYLDLADGADFVAGVSAFDAAARAKNLFILSGVSSFPVLTAAAARRLSRDMARVDAIRGGVAPSPHAGVGLNVIRAIAGYAGQPVQITRDGAAAEAWPFTEQLRYTIAPPGRVPIRNTLFSLVDVPDLRALARLWPQARQVWMGAGPVPEFLHRALIALAWLARLRILPSLSPLAPLMHFVMNRMRFGEHRGGMFVEVRGADASGAPLRRSWHLNAEGDDGPLIPAMAVEALIRRALAGRLPAPGARAATGDLELEDYEALFSARAIHCGAREDAAEGPLYARLLGSAFDALPAEIRAMHARGGVHTARGRARVERGNNMFARGIAAIAGFPRGTPDTEVRVRFDALDGGETWTRTFGEKSFASRQFEGRGRSERLLCERFGPLVFAMALVAQAGRLSLVLRRWTAFGVPMPMWMCPRSESFETVEAGRFRFHVEISHPLVGLIVRYTGWLAPE